LADLGGSSPQSFACPRSRRQPPVDHPYARPAPSRALCTQPTTRFGFSRGPAGYRDLPAAAFRARAASHSAAPLFGYRLGLDAHNAGVAIEPDSSRLLRRLAGWPQRRADLIIVHNDAVEALVTSRRGVLVSVPDPLPTLAAVAPLQMARHLQSPVRLHVQPRRALSRRPRGGAPDRSRYRHYGAGDPLPQNRPSGQDADEVFNRGAVSTDNQVSGSPHSLCRAILDLRTQEAELQSEVALLQRELAQEWSRRFQRLLAVVGGG
jgi:hypothetical protein